MSKVNITNVPVGIISLSDIPQGTFFTGKIDNCKAGHFIKSYRGVVSFPDGETWSNIVNVNEYCECDVEMVFKPVR